MAKVPTTRLTKGVSVSIKGKNRECKPSPLAGEGGGGADGRGKLEQKRKKILYRTVLNTCLSFLNEVKNLAKNTGVKYAFCD